jgi:hypothetical protein
MRLAPASPERLKPAAEGDALTPSPSQTERGLLRLRKRWFVIAGVALVGVTILSRLPFMTRTLYAFDSANYALGVRDFYNVAFHQPHPPGYPLYVFFARGLDLLTNDANRALVLEGLLWSAVAVACTIALSRAMFGRTIALLSGVLLVFTVGFWGYGEVAYPYVALAGETAALALLAHAVLAGAAKLLVLLGAVWAISLGVRWDAAIFCIPLVIWAGWYASWRLRLISACVAAIIIGLWAVPMIALSGGWEVYRQTLADYLRVWSPQSAYVIGNFASGGDTQATYNLNFLVDYLRQMLGVGLVLILYLLGRRFGPGALTADYRGRLLALWVLPPLGVYIFAHLGEPGYVLSLAPQASILIGVAIVDLGADLADATGQLRAREWRWLPMPRTVGAVAAGLLTVAIVGWNVQAFVRGVGPGRLPDLRAHDATTSAQVDYIERQPVPSTLVLAHDIFRQLHYYVPQYRSELLFSEYVPDFQTTLTRTDLPAGTSQIVVLDSPLKVAPEDADRASEVVLSDEPHVSVWLVNASGATAVDHGYQYLRLIR